MRAIEADNPDLSGILRKGYTAIDNGTLASLLRHINGYTKDLEGDAFGLIYEYFLAKFALDDEVSEERLAAAHLELRELAARAAKLEASVDAVLARLLAK